VGVGGVGLCLGVWGCVWGCGVGFGCVGLRVVRVGMACLMVDVCKFDILMFWGWGCGWGVTLF